MAAINYKKKGLCICHKKTASTSIRTTLSYKPSWWGAIEPKHIDLDSIKSAWPKIFDLILNDNYYIFGFVRNPWDYAVSQYYQEISPKDFWNANPFKVDWNILDYVESVDQFKDKCTFEIFIKTIYIPPQIIENECTFNEIFKYEEIEKAWDSICRRFGEDRKLLRLNISTKKMNVLNIPYPSNYRTMYTEELVEIIREKNQGYIDQFNYKF